MIKRIKLLLLGLKARWQHKRKPLHIEFILTDHCNLNCKGCTHYSPLAPKEFADHDTLIANMARIGRVAEKEMQSAYLIGGEPTLYPRLPEAMRALREHFPTSKLYLFTNGLMLPRMDEDFWQTCRDTGMIIALTVYPIKFDYDAVRKLAAEKGVEVEIFGDRSQKRSFFRFGLDPDGKQNPKKAHLFCYNHGCVCVIGNRIYPCSTSACVSYLNKAAGTSFAHSEGDWIDVDSLASAGQIRDLRDKPVPFCRHCYVSYPEVTYAPSRRDPAEWIGEFADVGRKS